MNTPGASSTAGGSRGPHGEASSPRGASDKVAPWRRLRAVADRLRLQRDWYLVLVATVIGILMSGVAMAFILPLHWIEERTAHLPAGGAWWIVGLLPAAGGLAVGVVHHVLRRTGPGPGVPSVMFAVHRRQGRMPFLVAVRKWIASTLTLGTGGSAGAEGPIATIGAVFGSGMGRLLGTNAQQTTTLLGCGAAAGIASVFNAPIAGVFFVMEILLRDFSLRTFTPIVVASVIASALTQAVLGSEALFASGDFMSLEAFTVHEIPNYLVLGLVCGTAAAFFTRAVTSSAGLFERIRVHPIVRPAIGGALLGAIGLVWVYFLPDDERGVPEFFGNGYPVIRELLSPDHYAGASGEFGSVGRFLVVLVLLGLLKGIGTCLTIGSGGSGGVFAPSMLLGAAVGGAFGVVVESVGLFPSASPAHYALVGMAAMVAGTMHAPLTGILIVYEITRSYELILPLMFAAVIAVVTGRLWYGESVYTVSLSRQGVRLGSMSDLTILRRMTVGEVPLLAPVFVHPDDSAQRLLELSERLSTPDFIVTDRQSRYVGMVTGAELREALVYREAIPLLQVHELMRDDLPTLTPDMTVDVALDKFADHESSSLAVLNERGDGAVLGLISRSRLMRHYHRALEGDA